ncbi:MAG: pyridoxamine 5'-phosphate oxidase family protein [Candidatus Actinomarina sp.]|nr:pyridoxamine 5'-phosphate oxidase family protein [Acidimicrobiaceae bacterium]|tara:strand:+ start:1582 stop:2022 length:441 start_codon:yes stop_codon:yes gene_type:complete
MQLPDELKVAIDGDAFCAMATHLNTNEIQNHLMWIDYLGENLIINTEKGRQKTYNIRSDNNISLVIFEPQAMYSSWEIRGEVEEVIDDISANQHIDKLSNRYTGHPYNRENNVSWDDAQIKDREMWKIKVNKLISMVRPQAKSDPE